MKHEFLASSGVVFAFTVANLPAQCGIDVRELATPDNLDGLIRASIEWDRDGAGPLPPELVIAGTFNTIGGVLVKGIARLDPAAGWQPLASGLGGAASSLAIDANNHLLVGGAFGTAGGVAAPRIARFDGAQWHPLASPPPALVGEVTAMARHGAADLVFVETGQLRRFDGFTVSAIPLTGLTTAGVAADVARMPNGDTLLGGQFSAVAGVTARHVAVLSAATGAWSGFPGILDQGVTDVEPLPGGGFYAFGPFTSLNGSPAEHVVKRTGATWTTCPALGPADAQGTMGFADAAGEPVVASLGGVARLVAGAWQTLIPSNAFIYHGRGLATGALLVGHLRTASATRPAYGFLWANGGETPIYTGMGNEPTAGCRLADGSLVVYVRSNTATAHVNGVPAPGGFLKSQGGTWQALPTGPAPRAFSTAVTRINGIYPEANGDLIVVGSFTQIGGLAIAGVARFNGVTWHPVVSGNVEYHSSVRLRDGSIIVGNSGGGWRIVNGALQPVFTLPVGAMAKMAADPFTGGLVVIKTEILPPPQRISVDGYLGAPTPVPAILPLSSAQGITVLRDGRIVAVGASNTSTQRGFVYDSTGWSPLPGGPTDTLRGVAALPDGSYVVVGGLPIGAQGAIAPGAARWDGAQWLPWLTGRLPNLVDLGEGSVLLMSDFASSSPLRGAFAIAAATCPASTAAIPAGCTTTSATLAASAPWSGQALVTSATGLAWPSLAVFVTGLQAANVPLASLFATALPGCTLWTQPDVLTAALASNGVAENTIALPNSPAVVGAVFRQQCVAFATTGLPTVDATQALHFVVGSY
ncbi:MAG: hypothetical protein ACK58X_10640 [Planctomycetota bacterium]